MSIARIRTPDESPDATWDIWGCNYVGFRGLRDYSGEIFPDQQCQDCSTMDRTPAILVDRTDAETKGDAISQDAHLAEWLPDDDYSTDYEPLEYDSSTDLETESFLEGDDPDVGEEDDTSISESLREMYSPPSNYHKHGTWCNGFLYTRDGLSMELRDMLEDQACGSPRLPLEHIASPSCQSLQGINGHALSVAEMKNCRNHRFLLAKPPNWERETTDDIFEADSLFVLSGESNGSYASGAGRFVYPPQHGLDRVGVWTDFVNDGCNVSGMDSTSDLIGLNRLPALRRMETTPYPFVLS